MNDIKKHIDDINHIKNLMEKSSTFLSLSGLSGVFAGIYAIIGAAIVYYNESYFKFISSNSAVAFPTNKLLVLTGLATIILLLSLITGFILTRAKAKRLNLKVWDKSAKNLMQNLFIPLIAGGIFGMALLLKGWVGLVAPITLLFYGLGLYSASKYSFKELKYLGLSEILLGLIGTFYIGYGLLLWVIGFGLLHIIYGAVMYFKYEKGK